MDASSSQGPFMLAVLIAVIINIFISEPENESTALTLKNSSENPQLALKADLKEKSSQQRVLE